MYDELIKNLRGRSQFLLPHYGEETSYDSDLMKQAADAIEELANKLCNWCGVCPKERRRPWDCEIMWSNAPIPEVYIEPISEGEKMNCANNPAMVYESDENELLSGIIKCGGAITCVVSKNEEGET